MIDVSIIIVNYNTPELTKNCINSIISQTQGICYEIIVIDNGSTDNSSLILSADSRIKFISSSKNGGFGYGNNLGMKIAQGNFFLLLNSDTLLKNNAVLEFYKFATIHGDKYIYGCYMQDFYGNYANSFHFFPAFTIFQFLKRLIYKPNQTPDYKNKKVECICGADMFFSRKAYEICGGFDEKIFLYGEEGELQYRLKKRGYYCFIINTPQIIHLEGSSMTDSYKKRKIKWDSHFYILKKHMNFFTYIMARFYYFIRLKKHE